MVHPRLNALFFALLFSGCGLIGLYELDGDPVSDGIAPYTAGEPIKLCIGSHLLIDTSTPPGLCEAEGREGGGCEFDRDCPSPESCVCGRCVVQFCASSSDCPEDAICAGSPRRCQARCEFDEECGEYGICEANACIFACLENEHCPNGELCLAGRCRAIACGPSGSNCGPGERCVDQVYRGRAQHPAALSHEDGDEVSLFLEVHPLDEGISHIFRFTSPDGVHFDAEPAAPLDILPEGATSVSSPSAIYADDGSLELYYEIDDGAAIARAVDPVGLGVDFAEIEGTLLTPGEFGLGEGAIRAPSATLAFGRRILAYETRSGIGIAVERDGRFEAATEPVLTAGDIEDPESFTRVRSLRQPELVLDKGAGGRLILRLYFTANGIAQAVNPGGKFDVRNDSIALAGAVLEEDLAAFDFQPHPRNPVFARIQNFSPIDEGAPGITPWDGGYLLYFDSGNGVFVARNPNQ